MKILLRNRQRHRSLNKARISETAGNILTILKQDSAELSVLFVGDRKMTELNTRYRGIKKSTDVLSFEAGIPVAHPEAADVLGDVVINIPRAAAQAREYGTGFYEEINRLLIHGILHLLGHDHENPSDERVMRRKERSIRNALAEMD